MGGATSVMPVIRGECSHWSDTIDWTVRCDWLQVATAVTCSLQVLTLSLNFYRSADGALGRLEVRQKIQTDLTDTGLFHGFSCSSVYCFLVFSSFQE